jgi:hypothetical protein
MDLELLPLMDEMHGSRMLPPAPDEDRNAVSPRPYIRSREEVTMTTYMPRSAWTTTARGGDDLPASAVDEINVHYPASGNVKLNGLSAEDVARRLRGWRQYHIDGRGWSDIGYNMAVDGSGRIWTLRGLDRVGAHAASASNPNQNRHSIGVLFVIGNLEPPTEAAAAAFRQLRADILRRSPRATRVRGHGRVPGASTECPGTALLAAIDGGALTLPPTTTPTPEPEDDMPTPKDLWSYRNDEVEKGDTFGMLVEAYRRAGAAEKAAEYANAQLRSVGGGVAAIAKALADGKIDVAELTRVYDALSGKDQS